MQEVQGQGQMKLNFNHPTLQSSRSVCDNARRADRDNLTGKTGKCNRWTDKEQRNDKERQIPRGLIRSTLKGLKPEVKLMRYSKKR